VSSCSLSLPGEFNPWFVPFLFLTHFMCPNPPLPGVNSVPRLLFWIQTNRPLVRMFIPESLTIHCLLFLTPLILSPSRCPLGPPRVSVQEQTTPPFANFFTLAYPLLTSALPGTATDKVAFSTARRQSPRAPGLLRPHSPTLAVANTPGPLSQAHMDLSARSQNQSL